MYPKTQHLIFQSRCLTLKKSLNLFQLCVMVKRPFWLLTLQPIEGWLTRTTNSWFKCTKTKKATAFKSLDAHAISLVAKSQELSRKSTISQEVNMERNSQWQRKLKSMEKIAIHYTLTWDRTPVFMTQRKTRLMSSGGISVNSYLMEKERLLIIIHQPLLQMTFVHLYKNFYSEKKVFNRIKYPKSWYCKVL